MYFLAVNTLKPDADTRTLGEVIPLHIEWTKNMIAEGKCVQAGRWGKNGGMALVRAEGQSAAETLLNDDPLIKSGLVTVTVDRFFPDVAIP